MNYIAHIHIGCHTQTSLLGNFLGDFVKGSQLQDLPTEIEKGIRLHRCIDVFTDSHPLIVELRQNFPADIRRMSGVIIDIYFDYLLMQSWDDFSDIHFKKVFSQFYNQLEQFSLTGNLHFNKQAQRLKSHRWLHQYMHIETCFHAFLSIENRLKNKIIFAERAKDFVLKNSDLLESSFQQFYPECLDHGVRFIQSYVPSLSTREI